MSRILCIESSSQLSSIALFENNNKISQFISNEERAHSRLLATNIKQLLKESKLTFNDLSAIAVSAGPGSYTGLRIGVSIAKGLAMSLDIPLIGISTLEIMVQGIIAEQYICPMIDARRMEVYTAIYNKEAQTILSPQPMVLSDDSFQEELEKNPIHFIGDGAQKASNLIDHKNASFDADIFPLAGNMGGIALNKFNAGSFEDLDNFEPEYLKPVYTTKPKVKS